MLHARSSATILQQSRHTHCLCVIIASLLPSPCRTHFPAAPPHAVTPRLRHHRASAVILQCGAAGGGRHAGAGAFVWAGGPPVGECLCNDRKGLLQRAGSGEVTGVASPARCSCGSSCRASILRFFQQTIQLCVFLLQRNHQLLREILKSGIVHCEKPSRGCQKVGLPGDGAQAGPRRQARASDPCRRPNAVRPGWEPVQGQSTHRVPPVQVVTGRFQSRPGRSDDRRLDRTAVRPVRNLRGLGSAHRRQLAHPQRQAACGGNCCGNRSAAVALPAPLCALPRDSRHGTPPKKPPNMGHDKRGPCEIPLNLTAPISRVRSVKPQRLRLGSKLSTASPPRRRPGSVHQLERALLRPPARAHRTTRIQVDVCLARALASRVMSTHPS
jgi:hypothetical protein